MPNFNKVLIVGHLTRDIELRKTTSGMSVGDTGIAVNHKYTTKEGEKREEVCFVDVTFFGKQAEIVAEYSRKGRALLVEGRLRYETWEDKSGQKRSKHSIVADNFQFLGDGGKSSQQETVGAVAGEDEESF